MTNHCWYNLQTYIGKPTSGLQCNRNIQDFKHGRNGASTILILNECWFHYFRKNQYILINIGISWLNWLNFDPQPWFLTHFVVTGARGAEFVQPLHGSVAGGLETKPRGKVRDAMGAMGCGWKKCQKNRGLVHHLVHHLVHILVPPSFHGFERFQKPNLLVFKNLT